MKNTTFLGKNAVLGLGICILLCLGFINGHNSAYAASKKVIPRAKACIPMK